jgi:TolB-like protein/Tfp pilus assembly protein PilF
MSFYEELKRRNVVKVAVLYVVFSWLLLQVTDVLSSLLPVPEWAGALVVMLLILGFFPVMVFSWVYELTPEGLKREKDIDRDQSIVGQTGKKINVLIIVMLGLTIGVVVLDRLMPHQPAPAEAEGNSTETPVETTDQEPTAADPTAMAGSRFAPAPDRSIAVLPFADMSPDKDQEYFTDGLSEELLNLLAKIPELRVASRTSAFSYKGKDIRIAEVAEQLNVAHILEGSIRKSGNRVRITAQLIDADEDVHLWSETWDRTLDDVFAIQDEIASNVVDQLKVTLLGAAPVQTETDPQAYNLFLQARHLARQGSEKSMLRSIEMLDEVLALDPVYARAWGSLASNYINLAGNSLIDRDEGYAKAKDAANRAMEIDPDFGPAYSILAWYYENYAGDYQESARYHEKALTLAPNNESVLNSVAAFFSGLGREKEAIAIYRKLIERDPINATTWHNIGIAYFNDRDLDKATESFDRAIDVSPDMLLARIFQGYMFYLKDDYQPYLDAYARLSDDTGSELYRLLSEAAAYPFMGRDAEGARAMEQFEREYGDSWTYVIATVHARQGRTDEAFEWLERAYEIGGPSNISGAWNDVTLESLHDDPRWQPLIEKSGVTPQKLEALEFNFDLPT